MQILQKISKAESLFLAFGKYHFFHQYLLTYIQDATPTLHHKHIIGVSFILDGMEPILAILNQQGMN